MATQALEEAEAELKESQDKLDSLNAFVASELAKKKELEDSANRMKRKTA